MNQDMQEIRMMLNHDLDFTERRVIKAVEQIKAIANRPPERIMEDLPSAYKDLCTALGIRAAVIAEIDIVETIDGIDV